MLKKNKLKVIISGIIILLPMLFGMIVWNDLPDTMATHFGVSGNADGFSEKAFAVFGMPAIFLALQFFSLLITSLDKKQKDQNPKALGMIFWIIPMISLFISVILYGTALGRNIDLEMLVPAAIGVMFIFMGNYLPKVKQNSTLGIKISWTLRNEENWNKTHRFGGKLWVIGGFVMLFSALLPMEATIAVFVCVIALMAIAPFVYSYLIHKKHQKQGIEYNLKDKSRASKAGIIITAVLVPLIIIGIVVLMFTGDIKTSCSEHSLKIDATYWTDIEVNYADIDTVEYRTDISVGMKTNGFSSARLLMGVFQNDEFGSYTIYAYTDAKEFAVLTSDGKTLVIGMSDAKETKAIYDTILEKIGG